MLIDPPPHMGSTTTSPDRIFANLSPQREREREREREKEMGGKERRLRAFTHTYSALLRLTPQEPVSDGGAQSGRAKLYNVPLEAALSSQCKADAQRIVRDIQQHVEVGVLHLDPPAKPSV